MAQRSQVRGFTTAMMRSLRRGRQIRRGLGAPTVRALSQSQEPLARVRNSLTGNLDALVAPKDRPWHWYSCGPTVYDKAHIGHARTYVCTDIIRRVLAAVFQQDVVFAMGVTDIDDKIIQRTQQLNLPPAASEAFVRELEAEFFSDMEQLGNLRPDMVLRVTDHIDAVIDYIRGIVDQGYGYVADDGVYFDVEKFGARYGKLGVQHGEDDGYTGVSVGKRHRKDFALWKKAKPGEPKWDSPWGPGRPGWHIECSAMTHAVFGGEVDIHSGGIDLKFPHHTNEIAQCEAFHDCDGWVRYWLHTGHLHIEGRKMSKSLKNFITIQDLLRERSGHSTTSAADQFRMFCLLHNYNRDVTYSKEQMDEARLLLEDVHSGAQMVRTFVNAHAAESVSHSVRPTDASKRLTFQVHATRRAVRNALANDFDTRTAVFQLSSLLSEAKQYMSSVMTSANVRTDPLVATLRLLDEHWAVFGLQSLQPHSTTLSVRSAAPVDETAIETIIGVRTKIRELGLALRNSSQQQQQQQSSELRASIAWKDVLALSDQIRDVCASKLHVQIIDNDEGLPLWTTVSPQQGQSKASAASKANQPVQSVADVDPRDYFKQPQFDGLYSAYDEQGVPTHDAAGSELSKNARRKLEKKLAKYQQKREGKLSEEQSS